MFISAVTIVKFIELACFFSLIKTSLKRNLDLKQIVISIFALVPFYVAYEYASRYYFAYRVPIYTALITLSAMLFLKLFLNIRLKQGFIVLQFFYIMVCGGKIISNFILTHSFGSKTAGIELSPVHYIIQYLITFTVVGLIILAVRYSKLFSNIPKSIRYNVLFSGGVFITFTILLAWVNAFYYDRIIAYGFGRMVILLDVLLFIYLVYNLIVTNINHQTTKRLIDTLNEKNTMLQAMNKQLQEYAAMVEDLTAERERSRIARDTHDTLGRTMVLMITFLEKCKIKYNRNLDIKEDLSETIDIAREGMNELKRAISGLSPREVESDNFISSLKKLIEEYEVSGMNIDLAVHGVFHCDNRIAEILYRTCQEALTNALRHGKAKNVQIIVTLSPDRINLCIIDDGMGCMNLKKGFGLSGIEQNVKGLNGDVSFHAAGERGFIMDVGLPLDNQCMEVSIS